MNRAQRQAERIKKQIDDLNSDPEMRLERQKFAITEEICKFMESKNMSRVELAEKLGTSRAYITKMLRGNCNFTLESLERISSALDCELNIRLCPQGFKIPHLSLPVSQKKSGAKKKTGKS